MARDFVISAGAFLVVFLVEATCFYSTRIFETPGLGNFRNSTPNSNHGVFNIIYEWRFLDFEYPTYSSRLEALQTGKFIVENNLPLGVDMWADRIFITMPRWKGGVPASLGWLPYPAVERSPPIRPYPDWIAHADPESPDCSKLMSVYRTFIDECQRLWLIDAGVVNATIRLNQICPPKIVVYDLKTDQQILTYQLPADQVKQDSLHSNIVVDIQNGNCNGAHAYVTDVWRYGLIVFKMAELRSWRVTHHLFQADPFASDFTLHGLNFQWTDGIFGLSLLPVKNYAYKVLFYHPMASYREFMVSTEILRDENLWNGLNPNATAAAIKMFRTIGTRGTRGQSSTAGIDRENVMFFTLVLQDAIGCWDTTKSYSPDNLGVVEQNPVTLYFPNDLKIDREQEQGVWALSNRLPIYLYSKLDYNDVNFRIQRANVQEAVVGTICDPQISTENVGYAAARYSEYDDV